MLRLWGICGVLFCVISMIISSGDIGPGTWLVHHITKCEEVTHKFKFDIKRNKMNRTHDCFQATLNLDEDFSDIYGIRVDICKFMDGGCKQYQVLSDECFVNFVNKYAENNVKACLEMAGVDPPEFPIKKGEYDVVDYIFDYNELPSDAIYGLFEAKAVMMEGSLEVGCVKLRIEFKKKEEDDDDCDE